MRAVWSSAALLYTLASLMLAQVLAAPEANSDPTRSVEIDSEEALQRLKARHSNSPFLELEARFVSRTFSWAQPNIDERDADQTVDVAARNRWEKTQIKKDRIADRDQASMAHVEREIVSVSPAAEQQNQELSKFSLELRSAAPKVFGVSIYLIIAWLALMYLMYRTGSF